MQSQEADSVYKVLSRHCMVASIHVDSVAQLIKLIEEPGPRRLIATIVPRSLTSSGCEEIASTSVSAHRGA